MELETFDAATITTATDSKRSSLDAGNNFQVNTQVNTVGNLANNACDVDAEPYMSLGYEHGHGNSNHSHGQNPTRAGQLPEEPSTGTPYTPCKDPIYNARSWWEYGGGTHDYRWDCLRERAM
jgi:hypothetical protein